MPEISHSGFEGAEWKEPAGVLNCAVTIILSKCRGHHLTEKNNEYFQAFYVYQAYAY